MEATLPAASSAVRLERGQSLGRYVVLGELGAGGMAVVYAAFDAELDRKVALKLVRAEPERRARVRREAQAMARLSHPNVAQIYDVGEHEDSVFIAMEHVTGQTLGDWLRARRSDWRQVRDVFLQAGRGLVAAHAAGLVHRDFKPDNVLLDESGRVLVADFGLARPIAEADDDEPLPAADPAASLHSPLTHPGALLGTPRYMAPEQLARGPVDERADQFSFAVALYEGLYGQRPFAGETLTQLRAAIASGEVRPPPAGTGVPSWLHAAVVQGLAADPAKRHADLRTLLAELERDRKVSRVPLFAALNILLFAGVVAGALLVGKKPDPVCTGAARKLAGLWDPKRASDVEAAFADVPVPYATQSAASVRKTLDAYARDWAAMHQEACEATQVRREQSAAALDLRMSCLERRRDELRALVTLLAQPDRDIVQRAVAAAQALTPLAGCADLDALRAPLPEPADRRIAEARRRLSDARAALAAGRYPAGREQARTAVDGARDIGWPPLLGEALILRGELEDRLGDYSAAEASFAEGLTAAEAGRHDREKVRALNALITSAGVRANRHAEAHRYAAWSEAAISRLGGDDALAAARLDAVGLVLRAEGRYADALTAHGRARSLWARARGPEHKDVASSLAYMGSAARLAGRLAEGRAYSEAALAILQRLLGPSHPDVAGALISTGNAFRAEERGKEALERYARARAIRERALGPGHPDVAAVLVNIGLVHYDLGERAAARDYYQQALAIQEAALGPAHPLLATTVNNLGRLEAADGHPAEALAAYRRAHDIWLAAFGPEHTDVALSLRNQADAQAKLGHDADALGLCDRAVALFEKSHGAHSAYVLDAVILSIPMAARLGKDALARVERSVEILGRVGRDHDDLLPPLIKAARLVAGQRGARAVLEKLHAVAVAHQAPREQQDETAALAARP
jgi:tetratricopeptide (TPR) repeat protein/predicted Ser/Thr protein kinase